MLLEERSLLEAFPSDKFFHPPKGALTAKELLSEKGIIILKGKFLNKARH